MMDHLRALRDALAAVDGVKTSKIGMESTISPSDYPMIRIVPRNLGEASVRPVRTVECMIYFGMPIHEFQDGLEAVYESLFAMEAQLLAAGKAVPSLFLRHFETILDEDQVDAYKLMAMRVSVQSVPG